MTVIGSMHIVWTIAGSRSASSALLAAKVSPTIQLMAPILTYSMPSFLKNILLRIVASERILSKLSTSM